MAGRPSFKVKSKEGSHELNLLPIMNVIMILIPFLIMTAAMIELTIIDTSLPSRGSATPGEKEKTPDKPKLNLTLFITQEGFILAGYGGVLQVDNGVATESEEDKAKESKRFRIDKISVDGKDGKKEMDYDWDKLVKNLKKVKKSYPHHYSIILLPDNEVKYEIIVKLMDLSREYSETKNGKVVKEPMFPNPVLAWSVT